MSVYRFEDLRVWKAAKKQCDLVGSLIKRPEFAQDAQLVDQMNRASISVPFNISEGFLRRRDKETLQFLRYAFASNGELKSGYYVAEGRRYIASTELTDLIELNEHIARMIRRWQATLDVEAPETTKARHRTKDQGPRTDVGPRTDEGPRPKD